MPARNYYGLSIYVGIVGAWRIWVRLRSVSGGAPGGAAVSEAQQDLAEELAAWIGPVLVEVGLVAASDDERVTELCDLLAAEARLKGGPMKVPIPITKDQVDAANHLIEVYAPTAESTTAIQVALGNLALWLSSDGEYPRVVCEHKNLEHIVGSGPDDYNLSRCLDCGDVLRNAWRGAGGGPSI